jgi:putative FmdB family regulatory protein
MPIYEYRCRACGNLTEVLVLSAKNREGPTCSSCGGTDLEKALTAPASVVMAGGTPKGGTCCGRDERCATPPCSAGGPCRRD